MLPRASAVCRVVSLVLMGLAPVCTLSDPVCDEARRAAVAEPARFAISDDGTTVADSHTGLVWKRCSEGQTWDGTTCAGEASTHTWQQALRLAKKASFAGKSAWRLPTREELSSILERACHSPAIDLQVFPATPSAWFWSATPVTSCTGGAWAVGFDYGDGSSDDESSLNRVRLVRDGP